MGGDAGDSRKGMQQHVRQKIKEEIQKAVVEFTIFFDGNPYDELTFCTLAFSFIELLLNQSINLQSINQSINHHVLIIPAFNNEAIIIRVVRRSMASFVVIFRVSTSETNGGGSCST
jgi:hypothetical protein